MSAPSEGELRHHLEEIEWSVVSMCQHLGVVLAMDRDERELAAHAAFDGALLHLRALIEFFVQPRGAHVKAEHYCPGWRGAEEADALGLVGEEWWQELNVQAAHLSRRRWKASPAAPWDLFGPVEGVLSLLKQFLDCEHLMFRQEFFDILTEARLAMIAANELRERALEE